ncbi:RNA polymerase II accessory factor [Sporormia fimetaria CBS 119925]|uniref:RNA polymerase II accessory factor n=1 Tax=Sporormia fimetaria CBS 119925 TaxID=1340428 RepID=A0A6A6UZ40_9PLEO|nr:RNA polymerase II accessory factor [Sporormia fimetaria CBS 119925]
MAAQAEIDDALYNLRLSISRNTKPTLSTSENPLDVTESLAQATHITFNNGTQHKTFSLASPTRFAPGDQPVDLRSMYFAWLNKDSLVPDYIVATQHLNEELPSGAGGSVQHLAFGQRVDALGWLRGEENTGEYIKPLEGAGLTVDAEKSAAIASGQAGGVAVDKGGDTQKLADERLLQIYDGERKMGDHNTILRGTKPVDFSSYRKIAQTIFKTSSKPSAPLPMPTSSGTPLVSGLQKSRKHVQPIILLSPSASSLLRMSNIKSFLNDGVFVPPSTTDTQSLNLLQLTRTLPSISSQPLRFILVDSTSSFKPAYWDRVVAIFTTGQTWQFKGYKYPNPADLFSHYPGVYVGWQGEEPPESVTSLGRGVLSVKVDKWTGGAQGRWRDREVVEMVWRWIEEGMRREGWTGYGPGTAGATGR